MSMWDDLNELTNRRQEIEACDKRATSGNTQQNNGKMTARKRIEALLDNGSFIELGAFVKPRATNYNLTDIDAPADGVVTGYGTIDGRLIYIYAQDATVMGGSLGEMHAKKINHIYDLALKVGAPIIGLLDSQGMRLQEGSDAFEGYGQIFMKQTLASGIIPQITAILGTCGGSAAILPSLSDFVFMTNEYATLYLNAENTLDNTEDAMKDFGRATFHSSNVGICDCVSSSEIDLIEEVRRLVQLLPSNNQDGAPLQAFDDSLNRSMSTYNNAEPKELVIRDFLEELLDRESMFELKREYGTDVITALGSLGGMTVGIIATDRSEKDGRLTLKGCKKISEFVHKMDAFHIPIVTLVDVDGFSANIEEEMAGQAKEIAKMISVFSSATVPKINMLIGNGGGSSYISLNSKHIGADLAFAWPSATITVMEPRMAVKIMYAEEIGKSEDAGELMQQKSEQYAKEQASVYAAAERGYIDDIIEPASTRKRLIAGLDMLYTKYMMMPDRKHRSV